MFMLIKIIIIKIQKELIKWVSSLLIVGKENVSFRLFSNLRELSILNRNILSASR